MPIPEVSPIPDTPSVVNEEDSSDSEIDIPSHTKNESSSLDMNIKFDDLNSSSKFSQPKTYPNRFNE
jgi:hypothetical protein